ncbi:hypothetical protein H8356DRAFT_1344949 [Neocallimastix lanati (nom. inval.)]|nr:hypothetical protein H8356DRAFT_1344949 [Neocallimastix sp. JGI-2020a]
MVNKAINKLNKLKKYIKQKEGNVKKMINCMKTMNEYAKLKGDEVVLKQKLNLRNDSLNSNIAISDAEDSVYNYNTVRTEMDITTQMIAQTKQKLKYRRVTLILRKHEQSYKIKKNKYELLCEEVIQKIELLEAKRKADIPNYLQSVNNNNLSNERLMDNSNDKNNKYSNPI